MSSLHSLRPWQYEVSGGFTVRGVFTEPTGKPVLHFIHANGFCGLTYEKLLAPLQDYVDIFISDAQGHGDSDAGPEYAGWNRSALYFSEVWSHFSHLWAGVPKIACGHSYGAVMSSVMMAKQPALFDQAILLDPAYAPAMAGNAMYLLSQFGLTKHMVLSKQAAIRNTEWQSEEELWDYFHQRGVFEGWEDDCLRSYLKHAMRRTGTGSIQLKCPPRIEAAIFASYPRWLWSSLKSIRVPVTVLYGKKTFPFILNSLPKLQKANANFDLLGVDGGHCFMQEDSLATSRDILSILKTRLSLEAV